MVQNFLFIINYELTLFVYWFLFADRDTDTGTKWKISSNSDKKQKSIITSYLSTNKVVYQLCAFVKVATSASTARVR